MFLDCLTFESNLFLPFVLIDSVLPFDKTLHVINIIP